MLRGIFSKVDGWKLRSKGLLRAKIKQNYDSRIHACENSINSTLRRLFPKSRIPTFSVSPSTQQQTVQKLNQQVDRWTGVDLKAVKEKSKSLDKWTHKDYHERANNWCNRWKAEWSGNYLFYTLFTKEMDTYIESNTYEISNKSQNNSNNSINNDKLNKKLLKCILIRDMMVEKVKFIGTRELPLILDQSYTKSNLLTEFFRSLGQINDQCSIPFEIPTRDIVTLYHIFV